MQMLNILAEMAAGPKPDAPFTGTQPSDNFMAKVSTRVYFTFSIIMMVAYVVISLIPYFEFSSEMSSYVGFVSLMAIIALVIESGLRFNHYRMFNRASAIFDKRFSKVKAYINQLDLELYQNPELYNLSAAAVAAEELKMDDEKSNDRYLNETKLDKMPFMEEILNMLTTSISTMIVSCLTVIKVKYWKNLINNYSTIRSLPLFVVVFLLGAILFADSFIEFGGFLCWYILMVYLGDSIIESHLFLKKTTRETEDLCEKVVDLNDDIKDSIIKINQLMLNSDKTNKEKSDG